MLMVGVAFQSTHPVRGATSRAAAKAVTQAEFQSTHPVRGATRVSMGRHYYTIAISIHAPRAGCDHYQAKGAGVWLIFQSTHPVRGATAMAGHEVVMPRFQSTHPVRGATALGVDGGPAIGISIHAPRAGCDSDSSPGG